MVLSFLVPYAVCVWFHVPHGHHATLCHVPMDGGGVDGSVGQLPRRLHLLGTERSGAGAGGPIWVRGSCMCGMLRDVCVREAGSCAREWMLDLVCRRGVGVM